MMATVHPEMISKGRSCRSEYFRIQDRNGKTPCRLFAQSKLLNLLANLLVAVTDTIADNQFICLSFAITDV